MAAASTVWSRSFNEDSFCYQRFKKAIHCVYVEKTSKKHQLLNNNITTRWRVLASPTKNINIAIKMEPDSSPDAADGDGNNSADELDSGVELICICHPIRVYVPRKTPLVDCSPRNTPPTTITTTVKVKVEEGAGPLHNLHSTPTAPPAPVRQSKPDAVSSSTRNGVVETEAATASKSNNNNNKHKRDDDKRRPANPRREPPPPSTTNNNHNNRNNNDTYTIPKKRSAATQPSSSAGARNSHNRPPFSGVPMPTTTTNNYCYYNTRNDRKRPAPEPIQNSPAPSPKNPKKKVVAAATTTAYKSFKVATYNVWFGPTGQDQKVAHPKQRMIALSEELRRVKESDLSASSPLWFIGLQEITPLLRKTLFPRLEQMGYKVFCQDLLGGELLGSYGCAMAVLQYEHGGGDPLQQPRILDSGWHSYRESVMSRGFSYVRAQLPNSSQQVLFTTTHLESSNGPQYDGRIQRRKQIRELEAFCQRQMQQQQSQNQNLTLSFMSGDFNWDDESGFQANGGDHPMDKVLTNARWTDTWLQIREQMMEDKRARHNNKPIKQKDIPTCYTYDQKECPMLRGSKRVRFDRILVLSNVDDDHCHVRGVQLIGKEAIPGLTYQDVSTWNGNPKIQTRSTCPSDHFGYIAEVAVQIDAEEEEAATLAAATSANGARYGRVLNERGGSVGIDPSRREERRRRMAALA